MNAPLKPLEQAKLTFESWLNYLDSVSPTPRTSSLISRQAELPIPNPSERTVKNVWL